MHITDVLDRIYDELIAVCECTMFVPVYTEDIRIITKKSELRAFKLSHPVPDNFVRSKSLLECINSVKSRKDYLRLLEYFCMCNRVIVPDVVSVIPELWGGFQ